MATQRCNFCRFMQRRNFCYISVMMIAAYLLSITFHENNVLSIIYLNIDNYGLSFSNVNNTNITNNVNNRIFIKQNGDNDYDDKNKTYKLIIGHVINPYNCKPDNPSYLYYAQKITFKSMINAKYEALKEGILVNIYTTNYLEDDPIIDKYIKNTEFIQLPYLNRSLKSESDKLLNKYVRNNPYIKDYTIPNPKQLPFINDIIHNAYDYGNKDDQYIILTNIDIALQKNFYIHVYNLLEERRNKNKFASLIINKRIIPKRDPITNQTFTSNDKDMDIMYKLGQSNETSKKHPGSDCFVMDKKLIPKINLLQLFSGYGPWGTVMMMLLKKYSYAQRLKYEYVTFHLGQDGGTYSDIGKNGSAGGTRKLNDIIAANVDRGFNFGLCNHRNCSVQI